MPKPVRQPGRVLDLLMKLLLTYPNMRVAQAISNVTYNYRMTTGVQDIYSLEDEKLCSLIEQYLKDHAG